MAIKAKIKKASLWIAGRRPLVKRIKIVKVKRARLSNHHKVQPKYIASPKRMAVKIKKISLVSK